MLSTLEVQVVTYSDVREWVQAIADVGGAISSWDDPTRRIFGAVSTEGVAFEIGLSAFKASMRDSGFARSVKKALMTPQGRTEVVQQLAAGQIQLPAIPEAERKHPLSVEVRSQNYELAPTLRAWLDAVSGASGTLLEMSDPLFGVMGLAEVESPRTYLIRSDTFFNGPQEEGCPSEIAGLMASHLTPKVLCDMARQGAFHDWQPSASGTRLKHNLRQSPLEESAAVGVADSHRTVLETVSSAAFSTIIQRLGGNAAALTTESGRDLAVTAATEKGLT